MLTGWFILGGEFSCWRPCMSHKNHSCSSLALLVTRGPSFPSPLKEMAPGQKIWRSPGQGYSNLQTFKQTSKPTFKPSFKLSDKLSNLETSFEINLQTFKETFKLSNKFSNQPSIFETNFQTFKPTFKPTFKFSNKLPNQTVEPTFKPTFKIPNKLSNCQTNFQTNLQTFKQTSKLSNKFSNQHSNFQTNWELQVAPRVPWGASLTIQQATLSWGLSMVFFMETSAWATNQLSRLCALAVSQSSCTRHKKGIGLPIHACACGAIKVKSRACVTSVIQRSSEARGTRAQKVPFAPSPGKCLAVTTGLLSCIWIWS